MYALINGSTVVNTVYADSAFLTTYIAPSYTTTVNINSEIAGPGYAYSGGDFTPPANSPPYSNIPTITTLSAYSGVSTGGTSVTITGLYFDSAATVSFGGALATGVSVNAAGTSISCTSPAGTIGFQDVVVTNPAGTTATLSNSWYYFTSTTYNSGSGNYTVPSNSTYTTIELWGGGGGGGAGDAGAFPSGRGGGGGGGGGYVKKTVALGSGNTIAYNVGAGGSGGGSGGDNGVNGSDTTSTTYSLTAQGGRLGEGGGSGTGGNGGTGTGGDVNTTGGTGGNGSSGGGGGGGGTSPASGPSTGGSGGDYLDDPGAVGNNGRAVFTSF